MCLLFRYSPIGLEMQYETFFMFASENFVQVPLPKVTYYIVIQLFHETNYTNDT